MLDLSVLRGEHCTDASTSCTQQLSGQPPHQTFYNVVFPIDYVDVVFRIHTTILDVEL